MATRTGFAKILFSPLRITDKNIRLARGIARRPTLAADLCQKGTNVSRDRLAVFLRIDIDLTDLDIAEAFYAKLGFIRDPEEFSPAVKACGLVHRSGLRIHLIYNGEAAAEGNVLLDAPVKRVAGKDVPMPYAANLEKLALPSVAQVVEAAKAVTYR